MKLSVPAQANISDCVDKGVLSLTAAGVQLVAPSAMGMWQAFARPSPSHPPPRWLRPRRSLR